MTSLISWHSPSKSESALAVDELAGPGVTLLRSRIG
jgi:hypothetical protein